MLNERAGLVLDQVDRLFGEGTLAGLSDADLLERFVSRRDELAFGAIVARHGPMVLGVCRAILTDDHDAEDAFQATFLIMVQKARSLWVLGSLGSWLYRVAYRVALRARRSAARRRQQERQGALLKRQPADEGADSELTAVLCDELGRLPERYRAPVVLCHLEGFTHEAAAQLLGCPVGTVHGRLSRARALLRQRLARRGGVVPPALLGAGLTPLAARTSVSTALETATAQAAVQILGGRCGDAVSVSVAHLVQRTLRSTIMSKLKICLAAILALGAVSAGAVYVAVAQPTLLRDRLRGTSPLKPYVVKPGDLIRVEVLEALPGRPITGLRRVRSDGTISLGFYGDLEVAGLNRKQVKVKLIEHLRYFLNDEALGLVVPESMEENAKEVRVDPANSQVVFVDEQPLLNEWGGLPNDHDRTWPFSPDAPLTSQGPPSASPSPEIELRLSSIEMKLNMLLGSRQKASRGTK